jgi:hypothetical protein
MMADASWQPDPTGRHQYRYWDGSRWTEHVADAGVTAIDADLTPAAPTVAPPPTAPTATTPPQSATTSNGWSRGTIVLCVGAVALGVGSIAPWAKASAGIFSRSVNGTEGDGVITIVLAVVILLIALATSTATARRGLLALALLCALGAGFVGIYDTVNVNDAAKRAEDASSFVNATVGWGLYVVIAGAALAAFGVAMRLGELPKVAATAPAAPVTPDQDGGSGDQVQE